jgi:Fe-S oxidoreductase
MYSAEAIGLFGAVKRIFDPVGLLNPGVIVAPAPLDADLRVPAARPIRRGLGFAYPDDRGDFAAAVHRCVGVGKCRADTTATGGVMCPSFLATRDEKDSTRGRARVLQELANGSLVRDWRAPEISEALDCAVLQGLLGDCPVGGHGDRSPRRSTSGMPLGFARRRITARLAAALAALAARAPWLANGSLRVAGGPAAKRLGGIANAAPAYRRTASQTGFAGRGRAGDQPAAKPVLLWVDTFTNAFTPEVGQAAVTVLEAAGYEVRITPRQMCCGLTWISTGQLDGARRQLRRTLRALGPALDEGIPIVGLEPSCTAALRADAAELLPRTKRAKRLGAAVTTLAELLRATDGWTPPDLSDVSGVAQPHCHQHATGGWAADAALLAAAGAQVSPVGGCCGLPGNSVERGNYDVSAAVAEPRCPRGARGTGTRRCSPTFSCRPSSTSSPTSRAPTWRSPRAWGAFHRFATARPTCPIYPHGTDG